jgi:phosphoribosyl 1,2-cyclic phosphodiesterase
MSVAQLSVEQMRTALTEWRRSGGGPAMQTTLDRCSELIDEIERLRVPVRFTCQCGRQFEVAGATHIVGILPLAQET